MFSVKPETPSGVNLSPDLSPGQSQVDAWLALRQAARALEIAANAMLQGSFAPGTFPPLSPAAAIVTSGVAEPYSVAQAVNDFLRAKARAGRSDRYLRQAKVSLSHFARGRAFVPLAEISVEQIEGWMTKNNWAGRTQRGYLADVRTLFNFAVKRGLVRHNPAAAVELPASDSTRPPGIHTPSEVRAVMQAVQLIDLDVCRHLAVRYFAGVRTSEMHRLDETHLRHDAGLVEIPAAKSKTRRRRLITIQPNLAAWLTLGGTLRPIGAMTVRAVLAKALKASGVKWKDNVTRHSFVSYHLAQFQNAGKTALEAGHTEQMTFSNYREIVTPAEAKEFWEIRPR